VSTRGLNPLWFVAIGAVLLIGCPAYVLYTSAADKSAESGMKEAAASYLDAWRDARPDAAEKLICGDERAKPAALRRLPYPGSAALASYRVTDTEVFRNSESPTTYAVDAELVLAGGGRRQVRYWMSDEDDGWRVCVESVPS
jgi:hypothetical protein